ncbi:MAG: hypothetical protein ACOH5I_14565 [Oligoflexus sp.]
MRGVIFYTLLCMATACGQSTDKHVDGSKSFSTEFQKRFIADPGTTGPYTVRSYNKNLASSAYQSAIIYYPVASGSIQTTRFPATTLTGGYTNSKEQIAWLGQHMASHGIVSIVFTPKNRMSSNPSVWSTGHQGSVEKLIQENSRANSPIVGRIDTNRIGLMGYSMGAAGALLAANELGSKIRSVVTLCAYQPVIPRSDIPTMYITGNRDTVASPQTILSAFERSRAPSYKAYAKFNGLGHIDPIIWGRNHDRIARYATAWQRMFLASDISYFTYLNGDELKNELQNRAIFAQPKDYIFYQKE